MKKPASLALALCLVPAMANAATGNVDIYGVLNMSVASTAGTTQLSPFPLWHNNLTDRNGVAGSMLSFGSLLVGTSEDCAYGAVGVDGNTTVMVTNTVKMVAPDGTSLGTIKHKFVSEPVPAPGNPLPSCAINSNMPIWGNMGLAAANGQAYVVIGSAYMGTASVPGETSQIIKDNSSYTIAVYNMDGSLKWKKRLVGLRGDFVLDPASSASPYQGLNGLLHKSGVGDFLNADGNAEIKVASVKKIEGGLAYTYSYFDLETGALIKKVGFSVK